jgi:cation diffusion facilitator family transporter
MTVALGRPEHSSATSQKTRIAALSAVATIGLVVAKVAVAWHTGSLGVLSEAADSAMDFIAALVTFFAVRLADQPADREHHYGHAKVENLSALVQTALLLLTCGWIIYEALERLLVKTVEIQPSWLAFGVVLASIAVNAWRSRAMARTAALTGSQALEAGALNFHTDIWASLTVLTGLGGVWAGQRWGVPGLLHADAIAAIIVAAIVLLLGGRLGKRAVDALMDRAPEELVERVRAAIHSVPEVQGPVSLRARTAGPYLFVDAAVSIGRGASFEGAHAIATQVEERVREVVPEASVVIHAEPLRLPDESLGEAVRLIVRRHALGTHDMLIYEAGGVRGVDLHLELPGETPLTEAHAITGRIEAEMRRELPRLGPIHIHVDPVRAVGPGGPQLYVDASRLEARLAELARGISGIRQVYDVTARPLRGGLWVICHAKMDARLSVKEAHDLGRELARLAHASLPGMHRLTVHAEPAEPVPGAGCPVPSVDAGDAERGRRNAER